MSDHDIQNFLEHHGIKGMRWGVRKEDSVGGFRAETSGPKIDPTLHASTQQSAKEVADLISNRYGFQIHEVKNLQTSNPAEYAHGTVAFVAFTPGKSGGVIHARPNDITTQMKHENNKGWMAEGTNDVRGLLTHESAHAMFHADQSKSNPRQAARDKALTSLLQNYPGLRLSKVSGYAHASGTREELEAEMFSQYHWAKKTSPEVKLWGQTLHKELGIDPTPFKEVVKHG